MLKFTSEVRPCSHITMQCLSTIFMLLLLNNPYYHSDLASCSYLYVNASSTLTCMKFRGKYLSRRLPYPSSGSFNPYVISNKEAHIINGNINNKENTECLHSNQNRLMSVDISSSEGILCRNHFQNYCLTHFGKFSCAVDCFLELCYFIFWTPLHNITRNEFFDIIYESCNARQNFGAVDIVREPVWSSIRNQCPSFYGMTADAVFSDIFTMRTVGNLSDDLKSLFLIQQRSQTSCSLCARHIVKIAGILVLYITCPILRSRDFENYVLEAVLPNTRALYCEICDKQSGDIPTMQHFVTMPRFLMTELSHDCINIIQFPLNMDVLGNFYSLKAVIRCIGHHFTVAINSGTSWLYYDDLCATVKEYCDFQELLREFCNGWFFAIYEKSCMFSVDRVCRQNLSNLPKISLCSFQSPTLINSSIRGNKELTKGIEQNAYENKYISQRKNNKAKIEKDAHHKTQNIFMKDCIKIKLANSNDGNNHKRAEYMREYRKRKKFNDMNVSQLESDKKVCKACNKLNRAEYMKEYRNRKKMECNSYETCTLSQKIKKAEYMNEYRKRKNFECNGHESQTSSKKGKRAEYMKEYRKCKEMGDTNVSESESDKIAHPVSEKDIYLSQFESKQNGPIHNQKWAIKNMQAFHNAMKFKIYRCEICLEAWPLSEKSKVKVPYICSRCARDKKTVKKFSVQNNMIPSQVPIELQGLTQLEEMLIARVFPVISVYTKPGGQKAYRGHCINFCQDIQQLADSLPRYPKDIPVIVVSVIGKDNISKDLIVRRQKVSSALHWLVLHNPVYKEITIDYECLEFLPVEGIPHDLTKINVSENCQGDEIDPDRGPIEVDDIPFNEETELSSTILTPINLKPQKDLITDELLQKQKMSWPTRNGSPLNEFKIECLATMAFPTLFPDSKGDPTNSAIMRNLTLGEKIKHLIKFAEYSDGKWVYRFASHPRFAYWAFNMIQRHRLLSQGSIFLKQNPGEAKLTVEQLQQMLKSNSYSTLMSKLMHYAKNITGSNSYWHKAKEDLRATIAQVGTPTIFFTLSCAEYHWPEFHNLIDSQCEFLTPEIRLQHVLQNPHLLDWLFTERTGRFVKSWLKESLGATWHWFRYEYAVQRGSIHCHGVAKLQNDPGLCKLTEVALQGFLASKYIDEKHTCLSMEEQKELENKVKKGKQAEFVVLQYVDFLLSTWNPCSPDEGWSKPDTHPCQKSYLSLKDDQMENDYIDLLNSVQRHTKCSTKYCLRKGESNSELECRFNFPFDDCGKTKIEFEQVHTKSGQQKYKAVIVTKRNDSRLNRHQPLQLQGWRANCDIQIIVDYQACLEYLVKYASKGEKASSVLNNAFTNVVQKLTDVSDIPSSFKHIMMKSVGQRDYSIQEVMHHLLSLKCVSSTFDVITASLDGSRRIQMAPNKEFCTAPSVLDIYAEREKHLKTFPEILKYNFMQFVSLFTQKGAKLQKRKCPVIVKTYPKYSSNPENTYYGLFCKYELLKYKPWQNTPDNVWDNGEQSDETFKTCWMNFLCSDAGKELVPDWEIKLRTLKASVRLDYDNSVLNVPQAQEEKEEWMLMSELNIRDINNDIQCVSVPDSYWHSINKMFNESELNSVASWLSNQKSINDPQWHMEPRMVDVSSFSDNQSIAYNLVRKHVQTENKDPLHLLITGIAGSGKSYVIHAMRNLLQSKCQVLAYTGKASFNINGITLHSFLKLPIGSKRLMELKGPALQQLQNNLENIEYMIIDEYSFVGQSLLGWIDSRCRQATGRADIPFGGVSVIIVGDIAQLTPVGDKPLYHTMPKSEKQIQGLLMYQQFKQVIRLTVNHRVNGYKISQSLFRDLLLRARNGESTAADWQTLLTRTPQQIPNLAEFESVAVRLCYSKAKVAEINMERLNSLNCPVATVKARHSGGANSLGADEMGGLEPVLYLAKGARVMLTMNIWTNVGLCNGALGTVKDFVYAEGQVPPMLPISVLVQFDEGYGGPSLCTSIPRCVPVSPITVTSESLAGKCERQQLPLKLAWAITIHKSQGLTLKKAWVDLGDSEKSLGITYVALSRVKKLEDLVVEPMTLQRLQAAKESTNMKYRIQEEQRLNNIAEATVTLLKNSFKEV